jgi:hypothetical protein
MLSLDSELATFLIPMTEFDRVLREDGPGQLQSW